MMKKRFTKNRMVTAGLISLGILCLTGTALRVKATEEGEESVFAFEETTEQETAEPTAGEDADGNEMITVEDGEGVFADEKEDIFDDAGDAVSDEGDTGDFENTAEDLSAGAEESDLSDDWMIEDMEPWMEEEELTEEFLWEIESELFPAEETQSEQPEVSEEKAPETEMTEFTFEEETAAEENEEKGSGSENAGECGKEGSGVFWMITKEGVLEITGSGEMADYSETAPAPWSERMDIAEIIVGEGVESIGEYAFYGCSSAGEIHLPRDIQAIGTNAFAGCSMNVDLVVY